MLDPLDLFEFETTEGGDDGATAVAAVDPDDDPGVEPNETGGEGEPTARSDEPTPPDYTEFLASPEAQQLIDERAGQAAAQSEARITERLAQALGVNGDQATQAPPIPDPFSDDYAQQMAARDQWLVDQTLQQVQQLTGPMQAETQMRQINTAVEGAIAGSEGHFTGDDAEDVNRAAASFLVGNDGQLVDLKSAAKQGADWLAQRDKRVGEAAVKSHTEHLKTIGDAPTDGTSTGEGADIPAEPADEIEAAMRFAARLKSGA